MVEHIAGQGTGTTVFHPLMTASGPQDTTQPLIVDGAISTIGEIGSILGRISTNNSTTTTLGANGSFVGVGDEVTNYSTVVTTLFADESSATDGMTFEFSTDNVNWDDTILFTLTSGTTTSTRRFQFPVTAQFFRINYTNAADAQGVFRVQTIYHPNNTLTTIHRIADNSLEDRSAQLVKSVICAQKPNNDFVLIDATAGGNLKVAVEDFDTIGSVLVTNAAPAPQGFVNNEIIRKDSGSPAVNYVFSNAIQGVSIENLGSSPIYFAFDGTPDPSAEGTGFLDQRNTIALDIQLGSVGIQGSGTTTPEVQVIGVY